MQFGTAETGVSLSERRGEDERNLRTSKIISFDAVPGAGPGDQTLATGVAPAISVDGRWLTDYRQQAVYPTG